jgi:excisionase family DNA binding protein
MRLRDLATHPEPFVTVAELARYWSVSRRQVYKQIEEGRLPAIKMGPRSVRVPTRGAAEFEKQSAFNPCDVSGTHESFEGDD